MALLDWDITKRLQFYIDKDTVDENLEPVPFVFRLSSDTGTSNFDSRYVFDNLVTGTSSVANRKKIAFSQIINGEEQPLFCELDMWDHIEHIAILWVKPIELSSEYHNIFYFYFDKNHVDNVQYVSETNSLSVSLFMDIGIEGTYDVNGVFPLDILKVGDKYQLWYSGHDNSIWNILYCESTDFITWTNHQRVLDHTHTYDTSHQYSGAVLYEDDLYKMWYIGYDGSKYRVLYCDSSDGISWNNFQLVIDISKTAYSTYYILNCAVIKEGSTYKMWYGGYSNSTNCRIIYCESQDGITWYSHQMVLNYTEISETCDRIRPCKVLYKNGLYRMWLEIYTGTSWLLYYGESTNGINWENLKRFTNLNTLGVYDTLHNEFLCMLEYNGYYNFLYGGYSDKWRMLLAKSVSLENPRTPSQEVWGDTFFSVHHFNSSYGYIDSTTNRLNVESTNNVTPIASNIESTALELISYDSYINFGNNDHYDFSGDTSIIIFAEFSSGNSIINRGYYTDTSLHFYYQEDPIALTSINDSFTGNDGDAPTSLLWGLNNKYKLLDNKLHVKMEPSDDGGKGQSISSYYRLQGDFDIQIDFESITLDDISTNSIMIYFSVYSETDSSAYAFIGIGMNSGIKYWTRIQTPGSACCSDTTVLREYSTGSLSLRRSGSTIYMYYKDSGNVDWVLARSGTFCNHDIKVTLNCWRNSETYDLEGYWDNFIHNSGQVLFSQNSLVPNSLNLELGIEEVVNLTTFPSTLVNSIWTSYMFSHSNDPGANTNIKIYNELEMAQEFDNIINTDEDLYLGGTKNDSIVGKVSEVWFAKKIISGNTLDFINKNLKDQVLKISNKYVQGYITAYNVAKETKVLAYDKDTKQLIGYTETASDNGYYYLETVSEDDCFLIALDGGLYNHFILGKIFPSTV